MAAALSLLFLLLILLPSLSLSRPPKHTSTSTSNPSNSSSSSCSGRWIHIIPLPPPRFNTDLLLTCDSFPLLSPSPSLCPYLANHALGPRTHNCSRSWFRTDPLLLEPLFHRRLLEYPCLIPFPSLASAFFLPYYSSLDALPFLFSPHHFNSSPSHDLIS